MDITEQELFKKLGIIITGLRYEHTGMRTKNAMLLRSGTFLIEDEKFAESCKLIELIDEIHKSANPAIKEQLNHLITLIELTKEEK